MGCAEVGGVTTGGGGGIAFSALSKVYKTIRNKGVFNDSLLGYHEMKCLDNNNQLQSVPAMKFFEMVEKGTLKNEFKEVFGRIHLVKGVYEERRYKTFFKAVSKLIGLYA